MASIVYVNVQDIFPHFPGNIFRSETLHLLLRIILESFKLHYFFLASNTCDGYFAAQTRIRSDASSCYTVANLDAREFWCAVSGFGQCLIVSGVTTFKKIQMFGGQTFMFEPTLDIFSPYVSTVGSKRRYLSSRVCVDFAGRDSCRFLQ